ncbi:hypothetical protein LCGC14_0221270 [marine sediment metagenome]|uniref:Uncharacterized protein n=1 Tax=marine sediment metagenome TaxID=412755 RepID=A0A0F9UHZ9_9ZZZZ
MKTRDGYKIKKRHVYFYVPRSNTCGTNKYKIYKTRCSCFFEGDQIGMTNNIFLRGIDTKHTLFRDLKKAKQLCLRRLYRERGKINKTIREFSE